MVLSEFIDRCSRPKQGLHHAESPDWWMRTECADTLSPLAPHFLEKNSTTISSSTMAEQTFLPSAAATLWTTVVGYDDGLRSAGASSLDIVHCFLLEPTDYWSASFEVLAFSSGGHLRTLCGYILRTDRRSWWPSFNVVCRGRPSQCFGASFPFWAFLFRMVDTSICIIPLGRAMACFWGCTSGMTWPHDLYYRYVNGLCTNKADISRL